MDVSSVILCTACPGRRHGPYCTGWGAEVGGIGRLSLGAPGRHAPEREVNSSPIPQLASCPLHVLPASPVVRRHPGEQLHPSLPCPLVLSLCPSYQRRDFVGTLTPGERVSLYERAGGEAVNWSGYTRSRRGPFVATEVWQVTRRHQFLGCSSEMVYPVLLVES